MRKILFILFALTSLLATDIDQLLISVKKDSLIESKNESERVKNFEANRADWAKKLKEAELELNALSNETKALNSKIESNEKELVRLEALLKEKSANLGEFFGVIKESLGEFRAHIKSSITSAEIPSRDAYLRFMDRENILPKAYDLEQFWKLYFEEIVLSGEVKKFTTKVVDLEGNSNTQEVIRIGQFGLISGGKNLYFKNSQIYEYKAQIEDTRKFEQSTSSAVITLDPTGGDLIDLFGKKATFIDQMQQGGFVGYVILVLGVFGALYGLFRIYLLFVIESKISKQIKDIKNPQNNNALGRVILAWQKDSAAGANDAIFKEIIQLEKGISTIKLLASVAPLLGLLGTVIGMIATFESITLFGTNDPKLMASGISLALVTTMQGLIVAVPLLFIHSFLSSKSTNLIDTIESESLGLAAQNG